MDPSACFARYLASLVSLDREEALDAAHDLAGWLSRGGFAPDWTSGEKVRFLHWCRVNRINVSGIV